MIATNISVKFSSFIIDGFSDLNLHGAAFGDELPGGALALSTNF